MENSRQCLYCHRALLGRLDKKFCTDQCRSMAHNRKRQENKGERMVRHINSVLRHNRALLRQASPQGKTTVSRQILAQAGFHFGYHTHLYRTQKGNTYHFCYDYGYLLLSEGKVLLVNWQPYMQEIP